MPKELGAQPNKVTTTRSGLRYKKAFEFVLFDSIWVVVRGGAWPFLVGIYNYIYHECGPRSCTDKLFLGCCLLDNGAHTGISMQDDRFQLI